ncbi:MAG: cohesin domain-containing protein, partial [Acutalibacteraceae bacterium]
MAENVYFDTEYLSITKADLSTATIDNFDIEVDVVNNYVNIQGTPSDGATPIDYTGEFVTMVFTVVKEGETSVYFNNPDPDDPQFFDQDATEMVDFVGKSLTLNKAADPEPTPDPDPVTGNSFSLTADKTSAAVGEKITVTYSIDSLSNGLFAMAENVYFDTEYLSITKADLSTATVDNFDIEVDVVGNYVNIQGTPSDGATPTDYTGAFVTMVFTVVKAGETSVYFNDPDPDDPQFFDQDATEILDFTGKSLTLNAGSDPEPTPVTYEVTFKDVDGSVLATVETDTDGKIDTTKIPELPISAEYVYAWSCGEIPETFTEDTVITMVKSDRTYTITAVNCTADKASATYKSALVVTADAEMDGKSFSCWKKNGVVVSYATTYRLIVYSDVTIEAVYGDEEATASAFIDAPYYTAYTAGKIKMVSSLQVVLPKDIKVESFEIRKLASSSAVTADTVLTTGTKVNAGSLTFNAQGRLDYSLVASSDSTKVTYIAFTATLSDGSTITSNVVSVSAQYARG